MQNLALVIQQFSLSIKRTKSLLLWRECKAQILYSFMRSTLCVGCNRHT